MLKSKDREEWAALRSLQFLLPAPSLRFGFWFLCPPLHYQREESGGEGSLPRKLEITEF